MKIFGWMHKKLHLGVEYHRVAQKNIPGLSIQDITNYIIPEMEKNAGDNGKLSAARETEKDMESLLLEHVLLTIGTLGHCPPPTPQLNEQEEEPLHDHHHYGEPDDTKFNKENPPSIIFHSPAIDMQIPNPDPFNTDSKSKQQEIVMEEEIVSAESLLKEDRVKTEKRTTLAELFAADSAAECFPELPLSTAMSTSADKNINKKKKTERTKKKKKKHNEEFSTPASTTKKIHQLITRMVKKKIHPDTVARGEHEAWHGKGGEDFPGGRTNHCYVHLV